MSFVPLSDWEGMQVVVLRQPRRKEEVLASVWGRLSYSAELANGQGKVIYAGPAITVEAVNPSKRFKFGKSLSADAASELERLVSDGHKLRRGARHHTFDLSLESCRATQLYRTIPHELGHWVDFLEKVERPSANESADYAGLLDRYHSRPTRERTPPSRLSLPAFLMCYSAVRRRMGPFSACLCVLLNSQFPSCS
jgi:hypothetical protein